MGRFFISVVLFTMMSAAAFAQQKTYSISGTVVSKETGQPVEFATIVLSSTEQWAVADANGNFTIQNVQPGKTQISISCLGYVTDTKEITVSKDIPVYWIELAEDNLTLDSVVVTAQDNSNSATTSRTIDKAALDHIQMLNVADVSSLLPGGGRHATRTFLQTRHLASVPALERPGMCLSELPLRLTASVFRTTEALLLSQTPPPGSPELPSTT